MPELPTGTVTLLFTDIEGSTQLLKALGDDYERVLSDHRALLRRAFNLCGGQVVDRQGDAFFVVFRRAKDAVTAAVEAQRALNSHPWPEGSTVRVRVGIHTGEPSIGDEGLTGFPVHVASRICGAAHGGQILVSSTTRDLVEDHLPARTALRDLGEYVLKDVDRPARLFQLVAEELEDSFPPPRTRNNGEVEVAPLVREEKEHAATVASQRPKPKPFHPDRALRLGGALRAAVRRRFGGAPIDDVGMQIRSMAWLSPSPEMGSALRGLGGAIVQSARGDRGAEHLLKSIHRRALQRRLDKLRNVAFLSERDAQLADCLAKQVAALERLASLRSALRAEITRIEARTNEIRQEIFVARLGGPFSDSLVNEVNAFCESVRSLGRRLQQAEHEAHTLSRQARRISG
ncbi:MAG: adenylate/guanylate cyclase domain-containing protein [Actinomycetota bacterium]|nr:adenylate/guanylate cyclase domain-containing protein [Actinomycetota bacterium]